MQVRDYAFGECVVHINLFILGIEKKAAKVNMLLLLSYLGLISFKPPL